MGATPALRRRGPPLRTFHDGQGRDEVTQGRGDATGPDREAGNAPDRAPAASRDTPPGSAAEPAVEPGRGPRPARERGSGGNPEGRGPEPDGDGDGGAADRGDRGAGDGVRDGGERDGGEREPGGDGAGEGPGPGPGSSAPTGRRRSRRVRPGWWMVSAVVLAAAVVFAIIRRRELGDALHLISAARTGPLVVAAALEAVSLACLAALQRWLLNAGGLRVRRALMGAIVLAANAVAGALPGGAGFAAAWTFRQLRRRGAVPALAGATLAVAGVLSQAGLFVLLFAGVATGDGSQPGHGIAPAVYGLTAGAVALALAVYGASRFRPARRRAGELWRAAGRRYPWLAGSQEALEALLRTLRTARPGLRPWLWPAGLAMANWLFDMACLVACMWSLGVRVPWQGLLVLYALTQLAGSLRITPGGLGVVETSLSALLVLHGATGGEAIAVTLLYRVMSYWALQPLGWICWVVVSLTGKRPSAVL